MKVNIFICAIILLNFINLVKSDFIYNITIKAVINTKVASNGYLVLATDGNVFTLKSTYRIYERFGLSIKNIDTNEIKGIPCFFYQFIETNSGPARIVCDIINIKPGFYMVNPTKTETQTVLNGRYKISISPINIPQKIEIFEGYEYYFYDQDEIDEEFETKSDTKTIKFNLFKSINTQNINIYLSSVIVPCLASGFNMSCTLRAKDFPQTRRFSTHSAYFTDSAGNKKPNLLVKPIEITLKYLPLETIRMSVTKLLTTCLSYSNYIVLDTDNNSLENMYFSHDGFQLKMNNVKYSVQRTLYCKFHKHPGENTKIFCDNVDDKDDFDTDDHTQPGAVESTPSGDYTLDYYSGTNYIKDDDISPIHQIYINNFKLNDQFYFASNIGNYNKEKLFDLYFREKISLSFKSKDEIQNLVLYVDDHNGRTQYYLGGILLTHTVTDTFLIFRVPASSYSTGLYYLQRMNTCNKLERIYTLPPIYLNIP